MEKYLFIISWHLFQAAQTIVNVVCNEPPMNHHILLECYEAVQEKKTQTIFLRCFGTCQGKHFDVYNTEHVTS